MDLNLLYLSSESTKPEYWNADPIDFKGLFRNYFNLKNEITKFGYM